MNILFDEVPQINLFPRAVEAAVILVNWCNFIVCIGTAHSHKAFVLLWLFLAENRTVHYI